MATETELLELKKQLDSCQRLCRSQAEKIQSLQDFQIHYQEEIVILRESRDWWKEEYSKMVPKKPRVC